MSQLTCPQCASENDPASDVCFNCGRPLMPADATIECPNCNTLNASVRSRCGKCGSPLSPDDFPGVNAVKTGPTDRPGSGDKDKAPGESSGSDELLPNWLRELQRQRQAVQSEEEPRLLDWLNQQKRKIKTGELDSAILPRHPEPDREVGEADRMPDWVSEVSGEEEWPTEPAGDEITDWLETLSEDARKAEDPNKPLAKTQPLSLSNELEGVPEQLVSEELPDWLDEVEQEEKAGSMVEPARAATQPAKRPDEPKKGVEVPGWLQMNDAEAIDEIVDRDQPQVDEEVESLSKAISKQEKVVDLSQDDLPEDLGDPEIEMQPSAGPAAFQQPQQTALPSWLDAMKSSTGVDSSFAQGDDFLETTGPLSGLRGVISVAPLMAEPLPLPQTPSYTMSKEHEQQVRLLRNLTSPPQVKADAIAKSTSYGDLIGARLIVLVFIVAVLGLWWIAPPIRNLLPSLGTQSVPENISSSYAELNNLDGKPALIAFEYSPSFSGELNAIAESYLTHLADIGSPVVTVSQGATGVFLASEMVSQVESLQQFSIGYLPGDAIGLRRLTSCLKERISCTDLPVSELDDATLSTIEEVGLIIVLTGDRDSLVNWIEQVATGVNIPMLVGITQAIAPVASPYIISGQLQGALNGVKEAALYDGQLRAYEGSAAKLAASTIVAQWVATLVLVVGAVYFGVSNVVRRRS